MNHMITTSAAGSAPAGNVAALPVYLSAIDAETYFTLDLTLAFLQERRAIAIRMDRPTDSIDAEISSTVEKMAAIRPGVNHAAA